jgi:hypothetical protein
MLYRSYHLCGMTSVATLTCALLATVFLASACDESEPPSGRPGTPATSPSPSGCPNEADLIADEGALRGPLRGDVTGDGRADEVFVAVDEGAEIGCRALLLVRFEGETVATSIDREDLEFALGLPVPVGLRQIDGRGGGDVIVDLAAGAATVFAGVFGFGDGGWEQIRVEGSQPPAVDLFAHGGGVGQLSGVDCGADGSVLISTAVPDGRRYLVERFTYEFDGRTLVRDPAQDVTRKVKFRELPRRFPEFGGPPFAGCPDA